MRDSANLGELRKQRDRAMTGETCSSIGSFATYISHEASSDRTISPTQTDEQVMSVTPVVSDMEEVPLEHQVQQAQYKATDALDALRQLSEGIRIITRQMKSAHDVFQGEEQSPEEEDTEIQRERSWSDSCSTIQSCTSDDDRRLSDLSQQLEGTLGADLLGLAHAAQMVGENSRMVSQEASQSVRDVLMAQQSVEDAEKRATKAENVVRIMYKKQKELIGQLEQTKKERNILKRQVKALLQEKSVMKEQDKVVRALELHVVSALHAHEQQLALQHAKRREENRSEDSGNVATVRLECPTYEDEHVAGKAEPQVHEEHLRATSQESAESKDTVAAAADNSEKFVDVAEQSTAKKPPEKPAPKQKPAPVSRGLGFGSSMGFVGGLGLRPRKKTNTKSGGFDFMASVTEKPRDLKKAPEKSVELKASEKKVETKEDNQVQKPALISPTNSVDDEVEQGSSEKTISTDVDKDDSAMEEEASATAKTSITTDSISPCNQASLISPSPTESSTLMKGFFNRSNKEQRRVSRPVGVGKKPLLQLDDQSVDATEGSHDYTATSETAPASLSTAESVFSSDGNLDPAPPKSLSCDTSGQISPFLHEFATGTSTTVLDDKAFRSLAIPSFVSRTPRKQPADTFSLTSPTVPPELAEIAEIYAEIGQLHEC